MTEETEVVEGGSVAEPEPISEPVTKPVSEPVSEPVEKSYDEIQVEKARKGGWRPIEEWDGAPEEWVDARDFNIRGEFIGQLKEAREQVRSVDERIANINQIHQAQMQQQMAELQARKAVAIDNDDAKLVDQLNTQMQAIPQVHIKPQIDPLLDQWNKNNTWVLEDTPKASRAREVYTREIMKPGNTMASILKAVNEDMEKNFPSTPSAPQTEAGSRPRGGSPKERALTMADVTPQEMKLRSINPAWADDKKFLQAITDSRREK